MTPPEFSFDDSAGGCGNMCLSGNQVGMFSGRLSVGNGRSSFLCNGKHIICNNAIFRLLTWIPKKGSRVATWLGNPGNP